jgi:hypothetical protein
MATVFSTTPNENDTKPILVLHTQENCEVMPHTKHGDVGAGISRYNREDKMSLHYLMSHTDADLTGHCHLFLYFTALSGRSCVEL